MDMLVLILAGLSLLLVLVVLFKAWRDLRTTTLTTATCWAIAGVGVWITAFVSESLLEVFSAGTRDLLWYLAAVVCVCPPIAVLGARRPGAAAWGFFVLLPLLLVLLWPAAASTRVWRVGVPLELEEPALVAFSVVLIMGCGNYFGTKFTLPSLLYFVSIAWLMASMSASAPDFLRHQTQARYWASILLGIAAGLARLRSGTASTTGDAWNRVWLDFTDTFGLVWAKRVLDRVNEAARYEQWAATVAWHGIVWRPDCPEAERTQTEARIDHNLRWLLKRFVDPEWIDRRLSESSSR